MPRTSRVALIVRLGAVAALIAGVGWLQRGGAEPPAPPELSSLDPELIDLIAATRAEVRAAPQDSAAWARLGMVYEANGFVGLAGDCYAQSVARRDTEARWWYRLALVRARLGDVEDAIAAARRASDLDPRYAPAHWRQGLWWLDRGELDAAEGAFRRVLEIDPADPAGSTGLARIDLARSQPQRAAGTLETLLAARPGDRYALQLLGRAYTQMGRRDEAAFALAVGLDGEPRWRDPWSDEVRRYRRGYATLLKDAVDHFQNGRFEEAIGIFEKLRERHESPALMTQLGAAYVAAGRIDSALSVLEPLVLANPGQVEAHVTLASAHLRKRNTEQALAHADRALALNPTHTRAREARGMILWRTDRYDEALAEFDQVYRADPRNAQALVWMGMVHADQRRYRDALARFEQAAVKSPVLVDAWLGIARTHVELGSIEQAATALGRAELLDRSHPQVRAGWERLEELGLARPPRE
ncbi:MAG: tetratricopeptide repeat protein [Acidobacteriota bacterium]